MKVHDFVLYNGEKMMLDLRLNCHKKFTDFLVLIETNLTHQGQPKPYYFEQQYNEFKEFHHKIKYFKFEVPNLGSSWANYILNRNLGILAAQDVDDNDLLFISDLDEIGREDTMKKLISEYNTPASGKMRFYHYKFNCFDPNTVWYGFSVISKKEALSFYPSLETNNLINREIGFEKIRNIRDKFKIYDSMGWHWTYLMNKEQIRNKLKSFAHAELNRQDVLSDENIDNALNNLQSLNPETRADWKFEKVELNSETAPQFVLDNKEKYKEFILE